MSPGKRGFRAHRFAPGGRPPQSTPSIPRDAAAYADILRDHAPAPAQDEAGGFYFNNTETLRRKTRHALDEGLAGIMIWELSMDTRDDTSLLRAITDEVARRGGR